MPNTPPTRCQLCKRHVAALTKHHLIPRTRHKNKRNKRELSREDARTRLAWLCDPCHKQVHAVLATKELERKYNTAEALAEHPEIRKSVAWIRKRRTLGSVRVREAKAAGPRGKDDRLAEKRNGRKA